LKGWIIGSSSLIPMILLKDKRRGKNEVASQRLTILTKRNYKKMGQTIIFLNIIGVCPF